VTLGTAHPLPGPLGAAGSAAKREHALRGLAQVVPQVPPVGDLNSPGGAAA
jgi:hypothetical protein